MNLAVFLQSVKANFKSHITSRFNKVLKSFDARWSD